MISCSHWGLFEMIGCAAFAVVQIDGELPTISMSFWMAPE